ncbi:MAG: hypothetical protein ACYSTS_17505 [Planctomycetota bacterium]|jgi:hypothetical protein
MKPDKCGNCGYELNRIPGYDPDKDIQCPKCDKNTLRPSVTDGVKFGEHLSMLQKRDDKVIGFSESVRQGLSSSAEQHDDESVSSTLKGKSPQGEEDTLEACRILIKAINQNGANWMEPIKGEEPADCIANDRKESTQQLLIQVVRARIDEKFWKKLSHNGKYAEKRELRELIEELKTSIEKKANKRVIPEDIRHKITLALDANRLPEFAFNSVTDYFQQYYGKWVRSLGFQAIWLVGPNVSMTSQLDK